MIRYGLNNLEAHRAAVNDLNVFPVPDGDTGTNMALTVQNGYKAIEHSTEEDLSRVALSFAGAAVFGARGNSGVILSQFFRGLAAGFEGHAEADAVVLSAALDSGCAYAYKAVSRPVEGTILTVLGDIAAEVRDHVATLRSVEETVELMTAAARVSLERTPDLLEILRKAGVVDSGGAGMVYFFEGIGKYLRGEEITAASEPVGGDTPFVDYTLFNRNSDFSYGYCTELLLQLTVAEAEFSQDGFSEALRGLGESIVTSFEGDKVKVHIHTPTPERVMAYCHAFGEFLTLKIENMSVQHTGLTTKFLVSPPDGDAALAVVAVAPNPLLQRMLADMGADVVILSEEAPSSNDFLEAFDKVEAEKILVFPNSSNSILSAMQAGSMYKGARVTVLNCRSVAQCYASLPIIDFADGDIHATVTAIHDTIGHLKEISIAHAVKTVHYGDKTITQNDYFAITGDEVLTIGASFADVARRTLETVLSEEDRDVITLFYGKNRTEEEAVALAEAAEILSGGAEVSVISALDPIYDLVITLE